MQKFCSRGAGVGGAGNTEENVTDVDWKNISNLESECMLTLLRHEWPEAKHNISISAVNENILPVEAKYDIILPLLSDPDSNLYIILYSILISFSLELLQEEGDEM